MKVITFEQGEEVTLEVRRHWIVLVVPAIFTGVVAFLPLVAYGILDGLNIEWKFSGNPKALAFFLYAGWLLISWVVGFVMWVDYYLDMWVVTDRRLIDVDQKGLFHREISSLRFEKVQEVTAEVHGILGTYFGFGTVHVQTAAEGTEFQITNVADPQKMVDEINAQIGKLSKSFQTHPINHV